MGEKLVKPDLQFVNDVIAAGGDSLKKCFQCATCSVVCNMTPEDHPFPRKEMIQAQWGLKDELFKNPDIWLCHQCSDCTAHCPRGAKPGEVLNAVRKMSIQHYSAPSWLAAMVNEPRFLLLLLVLPVVLLLGVIKANGIDMGNIQTVDGHIVFAKFIPTTKGIDPIFMSAFFFAAFMLLGGVKRYWADMSKVTAPKGNLVENIIEVVKEVMAHSNFKKCNVTAGRSTAHMIVFYSFIALAVTTTMAAGYLYGTEFGILHKEQPYSLLDPMKILGNAGAIALGLGVALVIMNRMGNSEKAGMGGYYDWLFIGVVTVIALTGIGAEVLRLAGMSIAYPVYFSHLIAVFFLFFYAPYSKMAHMLYRGTAMVFARMTNRK